MAAFLAAFALIGGTLFLLTRLLPGTHPARRRVTDAALWIWRNPIPFLKRLEKSAWILVAVFFMALTIFYS